MECLEGQQLPATVMPGECPGRGGLGAGSPAGSGLGPLLGTPVCVSPLWVPCSTAPPKAGGLRTLGEASDIPKARVKSACRLTEDPSPAGPAPSRLSCPGHLLRWVTAWIVARGRLSHQPGLAGAASVPVTAPTHRPTRLSPRAVAWPHGTSSGHQWVLWVPQTWAGCAQGGARGLRCPQLWSRSWGPAPVVTELCCVWGRGSPMCPLCPPVFHLADGYQHRGQQRVAFGIGVFVGPQRNVVWGWRCRGCPQRPFPRRPERSGLGMPSCGASCPQRHHPAWRGGRGARLRPSKPQEGRSRQRDRSVCGPGGVKPEALGAGAGGGVPGRCCPGVRAVERPPRPSPAPPPPGAERLAGFVEPFQSLQSRLHKLAQRGASLSRSAERGAQSPSCGLCAPGAVGAEAQGAPGPAPASGPALLAARGAGTCRWGWPSRGGPSWGPPWPWAAWDAEALWEERPACSGCVTVHPGVASLLPPPPGRGQEEGGHRPLPPGLGTSTEVGELAASLEEVALSWAWMEVSEVWGDRGGGWE